MNQFLILINFINIYLMKEHDHRSRSRRSVGGRKGGLQRGQLGLFAFLFSILHTEKRIQVRVKGIAWGGGGLGVAR